MTAADLQPALAVRRVMLTGAGGQVGLALQQVMPKGVALLALDRNALDITNRQAVTEAATRFRPDWIINAAAYTAVDKAESEPESAFAINGDGAANLAQAAAEIGARMLQLSTDYVFDGTQAQPYRPDDSVNPINVYGESKLAGEQAVSEALGGEALILRSAWIYSAQPGNFVTTMLRLMRERERLGVVEDQVGTPTSAASLAAAILAAMAKGVMGIHHWTDAGVASWYDFACAISELADPVTRGCRITPIPSTDYPTPARRPASSLLDKQSMRSAIGEEGLHWRKALQRTLSQMTESPARSR